MNADEARVNMAQNNPGRMNQTENKKAPLAGLPTITGN